MGICIFLRTKKKPNNFRKTILNIIQDTDIDYVLLTYPYFAEEKPYINSSGKKEYGKYSILNDELQNSILMRDNFTIYTISSATVDLWKESYEKFAEKLKDAICKSGKKIYYNNYEVGTKDKILHAKFCIGCKYIEEKWIPVVLVLGSSNLTNKAFAEYTKFNYESDIVLWNDNLYKFPYDKLEDGDLSPLYAVTKQGEEKKYIEYFYDKVVEAFANQDKL